MIFCWGACPLHCRMVGSILASTHQMPAAPPPLSWDHQTCLHVTKCLRTVSSSEPPLQTMWAERRPWRLISILTTQLLKQSSADPGVFPGCSRKQEQFNQTVLMERPDGVKCRPIPGEGAHITWFQSNKAKGHSGQHNASRL